MKLEKIGFWQLVIAEFLTAIVFILVRFAKDFGDYNLAFFRVFLSAIFIGFLFFISKKYKLVKLKYEKGKLVFFGAIHGFIILASFVSLNLLSISYAVILQSTIVIWTALFSVIILREKMTLKIGLSILVCFIGVLFLFNPSASFSRSSLIGISCGLFVGIFGGLVYALSKTFKRYDKISLTFWQNAIAIPFLIPLLFLQPMHFDSVNVFLVLSIGLFASLSHLFCFIWALVI